MAVRNGRQVNIGGPHPDAVEMPGKRWENGCCFANPDGTRTYICGGAPYNYRDGDEWKEIDNRWQTAIAPWNYQMLACQYQVRALTRFDAGQIVRLEKSGHHISYQPMALNFSNDLDQLQQIAMPQNVQGVVTDSGADSLCRSGEIKWGGAYGAGLDFTYIPSTHFFRKLLGIDVLATLGTPEQYILDGGNPVLQLNFVFETDLDLWIDGAKWAKKTRADTASIVEFKDGSGVCHWEWAVPSATGADGKPIAGTIRVKKNRGTSLYVSVLIPWDWLETAVYPVEIDSDTYYGGATDGFIYASEAADYATAHSTSNATSSIGYLTVGQAKAGAAYYVWRSFIEFDTSGIDDAATISQANLYLALAIDNTATNCIVRVHEYGWTSPLPAAETRREATYDGAPAATSPPPAGGIPLALFSQAVSGV